MKFYTEEEILDKHIGKKGTPKRDQFEADLNSFLIGEAITSSSVEEPNTRGIRESDRSAAGSNLPN